MGQGGGGGGQRENQRLERRYRLDPERMGKKRDEHCCRGNWCVLALLFDDDDSGHGGVRGLLQVTGLLRKRHGTGRDWSGVFPQWRIHF